MTTTREPSPIRRTVDNYCQALEAGSKTARDHLQGFVLSVVAEHDHTWQVLLGNATSRHLNTLISAGPLTVAMELNRLHRRLRWQKFSAKMGGDSEPLRAILRECIERFGDEYLCLLSREIANVMSQVVG